MSDAPHPEDYEINVVAQVGYVDDPVRVDMWVTCDGIKFGIVEFYGVTVKNALHNHDHAIAICADELGHEIVPVGMNTACMN